MNEVKTATTAAPAAREDKYAKKFPDRIRQTKAHDELDVLAGDVAATMSARLGQEISVSVRRSTERRYANVLFDVTIENDSVQTEHNSMTAPEVHIFFNGLNAMGVWMGQPVPVPVDTATETGQDDVVVALTLNPPHPVQDDEPAAIEALEAATEALDGTDDTNPADYDSEVLA